MHRTKQCIVKKQNKKNASLLQLGSVDLFFDLQLNFNEIHNATHIKTCVSGVYPTSNMKPYFLNWVYAFLALFLLLYGNNLYKCHVYSKVVVFLKSDILLIAPSTNAFFNLLSISLHHKVNLLMVLHVMYHKGQSAIRNLISQKFFGFIELIYSHFSFI